MSDNSVFPNMTYYIEESADIFPCYRPEGGLTKRELFAAMAMMGMLDSPTNVDKWTVERAVSMADSLIAELEKDKK